MSLKISWIKEGVHADKGKQVNGFFFEQKSNLNRLKYRRKRYLEKKIIFFIVAINRDINDCPLKSFLILNVFIVSITELLRWI